MRKSTTLLKRLLFFALALNPVLQTGRLLGADRSYWYCMYDSNDPDRSFKREYFFSAIFRGTGKPDIAARYERAFASYIQAEYDAHGTAHCYHDDNTSALQEQRNQDVVTAREQHFNHRQTNWKYDGEDQPEPSPGDSPDLSNTAWTNRNVNDGSVSTIRLDGKNGATQGYTRLDIKPDRGTWKLEGDHLTIQWQDWSEDFFVRDGVLVRNNGEHIVFRPAR